jgi:predicted branched-subunit amino acid permease
MSTLFGALAGTRITNSQSWGLDFAMVAAFIGMLIPFVKTRATRISILVAGVVSVLTYEMPNKLGLMVAALLGIVAGMLVEARWPERAAQHGSNQAETHVQEGQS